MTPGVFVSQQHGASMGRGVGCHTGDRRLVQRNRRLHENRRCVFYRSKHFLQMKAGSCSVNAVHEH